MNLKSIAIAAGAAVLTLTPSAALALSAGVVEQFGTNLRVLVSHRGAPLQVRMVAVDENYNELEDAKSFPDKILASQQSRRVNMRVPLNTYAICAISDEPVFNSGGQLGTGFIIESCARVNPNKLQRGRQLNFGGRRTPGGTGLRRSLQKPELQIIQQGEDGAVSS